jgi:hypothetical protein
VFLYPSTCYKQVVYRTEAKVVVLCGVVSVLQCYLRYWWIVRSKSVEWLLVSERHLQVLGKYLPKAARVSIAENVRILAHDAKLFQHKMSLFCYDVR